MKRLSKFLVAFLVLAFPFLVAGGWSDITTNWLGIRLGQSMAKPSDGNGVAFQSATNSWITTTSSGGGGITSIIAGTNITVTNPTGPAVTISATGGGSGGGFAPYSQGSSLGTTATGLNVDNGLTASLTGGTMKITPTYGTSANTFAQGNDSRLSDARTPTAHAASHQNGGSDEVATATGAANAIPKAGAGGTLDIGWIPTGSSGSTVAIGNDSRLSDARTPTAHAASHQNGGSDEVATATAAANAIPKAGAGGTLDIGWVPTGSSGSTVCVGNDSRLSNSRTPTAHAASHQNGGSDEVATATAAANAIPKAAAGGKLAAGWIQQVLALADLTDVTAKTGTGTTVVMDTNPTLQGATVASTTDLAATRLTFIPSDRGVEVSVVATAATATMLVSLKSVQVSDGTRGQILPAITSTSVSANTAGPALNGRDQSGAFATTTWVYGYAIAGDGKTSGFTLSTNATTPAFPSGYTRNSRPLFAYYSQASGFPTYTGYWAKGQWYFNTITTVLSGGVATGYTPISLTAYVPPTCTFIQQQSKIFGTAPGSGLNLSLDATNIFFNIADTVSGTTASNGECTMPCIAQNIYYKEGSASNTVSVESN